LLGRFETVAGAPDGGYEGGFAAAIELVSQVANVDVHHVGSGVEGIVPDGQEDLLPTENLSLVAHKVFQERELATRKVDQLLPAPHPVRAEVQLQVADLYPRRQRLVGATDESSHAGQQLLEVEGLGQVVVCPTVEGAYFVARRPFENTHHDATPLPPNLHLCKE
jgi:hypothetical protein